MHLQNPIAPDSLAALWELLGPLDELLQDHFAHTNRTSPAATFYYREYFTKLFDLFEKHPDGILKQEASARDLDGLQDRARMHAGSFLSQA